jgi:hypothetical protein
MQIEEFIKAFGFVEDCYDKLRAIAASFHGTRA